MSESGAVKAKTRRESLAMVLMQRDVARQERYMSGWVLYVGVQCNALSVALDANAAESPADDGAIGC